MLELFVDNQDSLLQVCKYYCIHCQLLIIIIIIDVYRKYSSFYGYGNGTIWLDYMYCNGAENKLIDCNHAYDIGFTTCGYNEMAGVYCQCMCIILN